MDSAQCLDCSIISSFPVFHLRSKVKLILKQNIYDPWKPTVQTSLFHSVFAGLVSGPSSGEDVGKMSGEEVISLLSHPGNLVIAIFLACVHSVTGLDLLTAFSLLLTVVSFVSLLLQWHCCSSAVTSCSVKFHDKNFSPLSLFPIRNWLSSPSHLTSFFSPGASDLNYFVRGCPCVQFLFRFQI